MIYRALLLFAGLALIAGLLLFSGPQREAVAPSTAGAAAPDPGYAAVNARLVQTGADGQPLYSLDAARIDQQPDAESVQMTQVQMGFRAANGQQWTARADRGELGQDTGIVQLDGNVHVAGLLPGSQDQAEIVSEHLSYDTRAQVVATPDPVTLTVSGRELHAHGLHAHLKEGRVQLESAVHGSYLPQ
jgi:LPS export ABC transporter protein LptC